MARVALIALALAACTFEHGSAGAQDGGGSGSGGGSDGSTSSTPWLAGYMHRKSIAITPPISGAIADFPVGVVEASDAQLAASARDDGTDIVFTKDDGTTILDHELVAFDGAGQGALEAWVRLASLPPGTTTMFMYYAGPQRTAAATATWASKFAGVWHLGASMTDSTSHAHGAIAATSTTTPAIVDGIAGKARSFDGVDDVLAISDPADGSLDFGTSSFSFSLWVYVTQSVGTFDSPLYKGGASNTDPGYCVLLGSSFWNLKTHDDGTQYRDPRAGMEALNAWVHLTAVVDRSASEMRAYRDGVLSDTQALNTYGSVSSVKNLIFGTNGTDPYRGLLDEVRITTGIRSPDWIVAEHANLTSQTFAVIGGEQTRM